MTPFPPLIPDTGPEPDPALGADFLALSQALQAPLCVVDARGRVLHANPGFARAAGTQAAALEGLNWLSCVRGDAQPQAIAAWILGVAGESAFTLEAALTGDGAGPAASAWQAVPVLWDGAIARWILMGPPPASGPADAGRLAWFRDSFEQAAVGIAHLALDGNFLHANGCYCAIVGHDRDALLRGGFQRITHPADLGEDEAHVAALLDGRIAHYALEKRYLRADGATVWAHLTVGLVRRADGTPDHFVSVINDITQRKAAEAALAAQQRLTRFQLRLSEWVHNLSDPVAMMEAATAALGQHLGVAQVGFGEIDAAQEHVTVHRDWNDGSIPSVVGTWRMDDFGPAFIRDMKAGKTIVIPDVELDERTSAPEVLAAYAGIRTRSILDMALIRGSRMVAMIFIHHPEPRAWTSEDVALLQHTCERLWSAVERARAEAALAQSEAQARHTAGVLENVIESIPDPIWTKDLDSRFTLLNSAAARMLASTRERLRGQRDWDLLPPDFAHAVQDEDRRIMGSGERVMAEETLVDPSTGQQRYFDSIKLPMRDAQGRITGLLGVARDVTQRKHAEMALLQSQQELAHLAQRLMEQERETTQRLAQLLHDGLGQTLGALRLRLDVLEASGAIAALSAEQQRHVLLLRELGRQAVSEVRTALVELRPPMLREQGLVAALDHKLQRRRDEGHSIAFTMVAGRELLRLRWPDAVEYAFFMVAREALANAVLHAGARRIECVVEGDAHWLRLRLRDDGRGVPDELHCPGHLGVVGMRERALAIGATFSIRRQPAGGTVVTLEWEDELDDAHLPG